MTDLACYHPSVVEVFNGLSKEGQAVKPLTIPKFSGTAAQFKQLVDRMLWLQRQNSSRYTPGQCSQAGEMKRRLRQLERRAAKARGRTSDDVQA